MTLSTSVDTQCHYVILFSAIDADCRIFIVVLIVCQYTEHQYAKCGGGKVTAQICFIAQDLFSFSSFSLDN